LNRLKLSPILALLLTLLAAFGVAMLMVVITLNPPQADLQQLFLFMVGTGGTTIAVVYWLYRRRLVQRFSSLRWTLLAIILLTVALVFINVFVTARLMFISEHDLILTTALLVYGGAIAVISVIFIAGTLIDRIHQLGDAARRLARGELSTRLPAGGNDELAQLTLLFNHMAEELEAVDLKKRELDQSRRDLVAWASHDLRSPLAAVRAMNEAIIDGVVRDEATIAQYRLQMQREIEHLGRLIDDLFELAKIDGGGGAPPRSSIDLETLICDALESMSARAAHKGIELTGDVPPDLPMIHAAHDRVARVLHNLLDNALHHTPAGGHITITAAAQAQGVSIRVHNTGSYIAPEDAARIFERFYRVESARTPRQAGDRGAGLGLAIARGFVEAHGGRIRVESDWERGTTFDVWLPLGDNDSSASPDRLRLSQALRES
jgi:signal transduction histidine kinase